MNATSMMPDRPQTEPPKATFLQTARTVFWSFFGVRRGSDHERDAGKANPAHIIIAGLIGAALFVLTLILIVRWIVGSGVAG